MDKLSTRFDLNEILGNEIGREKKKKKNTRLDGLSRGAWSRYKSLDSQSSE